MTSTEDLVRRMEKLRWFHRMDLAPGIETPGIVRASKRLARLRMPDDLTGKSVLDVGAWDGYFSFEAERRGAARVVAADSFSWTGQGWGSKAAFELARDALGSRVEDRDIDVIDLSPDTVGRFDLVLFLNVLYHMRHPLLALERVASVTAGQLILETHVDLTDVATPAMAFYPSGELWGDDTTFWSPNVPALLGMLTLVGFKAATLVSSSSTTWLRAHALALERKRQVPRDETLRRAWVVVHAWR